jgi:hypothetical protein
MAQPITHTQIWLLFFTGIFRDFPLLPIVLGQMVVDYIDFDACCIYTTAIAQYTRYARQQRLCTFDANCTCHFSYFSYHMEHWSRPSVLRLVETHTACQNPARLDGAHVARAVHDQRAECRRERERLLRHYVGDVFFRYIDWYLDNWMYRTKTQARMYRRERKTSVHQYIEKYMDHAHITNSVFFMRKRQRYPLYVIRFMNQYHLTEDSIRTVVTNPHHICLNCQSRQTFNFCENCTGAYCEHRHPQGCCFDN